MSENTNPPNKQNEQAEETQGTQVVSLSTKIKIIAAFFIVGVATYAAYWVQEPAQLRSDVMTGSSAQAQQAPTQEISIVDFSFDPAELHIEKGSTVTWVNKDSVPHSVVGDTFTSGTLDPGQSFSFTFNEEGTFEYYCSFHPQMKGTIKVGTVAADTSSVAQDSGQVAQNQQNETNAAQDADLHGAADTTTTTSTTDLDSLGSLTQAPEDPNIKTLTGTATTTTDVNAHTNVQDSSVETTVATTEGTTEGTSTDTSMKGVAEESNSLDNPKSLEATTENADKLANSGPEDLLYFFMFGAVLFFNRKKLFGVKAR